MDQNSFRSILKRYLQGQANAEEKKIIDTWYTNLEKHSPSISEEEDEDELEEFYVSAMASHARGERHLPSRFRLVSWSSVGIAASIVIALATYLYLFQSKSVANRDVLGIAKVDTVKWQEIVNNGEDQKLITLPDSSRINLKPQSKIRFSSAFGDKVRAVCLEGEAFFQVSRNEKVPFFVHVNRLTTKVLGTSFTVRAFREDSSVTVEVITGKVSVYTNKDRQRESAVDEVILTPNQKIVFDKTVNKLSRMIVSEPKAIIPAEEFDRMRFEGAPVKEIFDALEKVYGVDIAYDEEKFATCTLTTSISGQNIYNRLDIICKVIGASYEVKDGRIMINGPGCKNQ